MQITKNKNNLIVKIPLKQFRNNPYDEDEEKELVPALVGVIVNSEDDSGMMEQGIYSLNDLSYKDSTQLGAPLVHTYMEDSKFRNLCEDLELDVLEYNQCAFESCREILYGSHTINDKGEPICLEHEK